MMTDPLRNRRLLIGANCLSASILVCLLGVCIFANFGLSPRPFALEYLKLQPSPPPLRGKLARPVLQWVPLP